MKTNTLGSTGLMVSELCVGTLPMGPLQTDVPPEKGADLLLKAMESGVNFFDTAQMYRTYHYLKKALRQFGKDVIIVSKSTAADYKGMEDAITEALKELGRDFVDIFLLHAARSDGTLFEKRAGAVEALLKAKEQGRIRFAGVSTHHTGLVSRAAGVPEMDVVFPLINKLGLGILGGGLPEMLKSIEEVSKSGKGLYAMKVLSGGYLVSDMLDSINYVRAIPGMQAVSVGVVTMEELDLQLRIFNDEKIDPASLAGLKSNKQLKIIPFLCNSCGTCAKNCPNGAISMIEKVPEGKSDPAAPRRLIPVPDPAKCVLCGYCTPACPEFAMRLK